MPCLPSLARLTPAAALCAALSWIAAPMPAAAFCGFFVAKADADLFNEASKVVMTRDGYRTVLTMVNDYQGDPTDFAMVIPTPTVLEKEQIRVGDSALVDHLDAYTAPRIVEYHDENPCQPMRTMEMAVMSAAPMARGGGAQRERAASLGVTIEAQYTVGEYDILILSAEDSGGLQTWLDENGYKTPEAAKPVLASYIKQDMKFFVAKVNLAEKAKAGGEFLRPLQIAFESKKFMLPIRLGTVNAKGKQDLLLFTLTRTGRVETQNYRTIPIPSNVDVPVYVQKQFGDFYKAMFATAVEDEGGKTVFTEYAWDMNWCDPCAADPLSVAQLRDLGVHWLTAQDGGGSQPQLRQPGGAVDVFVTRLHLRYDAETFPEDLRLHETGDRQNFQGRYVTRHAYKGEMNCPAAETYRDKVVQRQSRAAETLSKLTGWPLEEIQTAMVENGEIAPEVKLDSGPWWRKMWDK